MVKVSCLMAAHNAAGTILESVESVLRQTRSDWELIIVDDGSTDGTAAVAAGIDDPRVTVLRQEKLGPSAARTRALAVARGEFVAPIDADDVWLPRKLELQVEALERRPDAAVAYGWTDFVDEKLRPLYADLRARFEGRVLEELLRKNFVACGSNTLMRRATVMEVGGFDETLQAAEDWELHTRLAARHSFVAVAEVVVLYRRSPRSLSSRFRLVEQHFLVANRKVFAAAPAEARWLEGKTRAAFYRYLLLRTMESRSTPGKWQAVPRYATIAVWNDPREFLREVWRALSRPGR
jgi:glycosyltransferase involved in cell wall biosynthesis